jgi:peroxiredoxin
MAATESTMLELGTYAPHFSLHDTAGAFVCVDDFWESKALLVAFICNHCPYVRHIRDEFSSLAREYLAKGVATVAIMPNDLAAYPQDGPEGMRQEHAAHGYTFPYLLDETQDVARAYRAACTPEFYLFDADRRLVYRGQFDDSRPGNAVPVTGSDLRAALDALLDGRPISPDQKPSVGCGIKWRAPIADS